MVGRPTMQQPWYAAKQEVAPARDRLADMRKNKASMDRRLATLRELIVECDAEARQMMALGNSSGARAAVARKMEHAKEQARVGALARTIQQQIDIIDEAALSAMAADSLRDGAAVIADVHASLKTSDIERDMVDMRMKARETKAVTRLMTQPLVTYDDEDGVGVDEDEQAALDAELAKISLDTTPLVAEKPVVRTPATSVVVSSLSGKSTRDVEAELGLL